ncbi:MAG: sensor histidine kinase [Solirubrobacteraceae bacterium]
MNSLRARVLTSVLVLAAVGMIALAAVTYAEQHSFLLSRLDQQVRSAHGSASQLLDSKGLIPGGGPGGSHDAFQDHRVAPPNVSLPPGTFLQRRDGSGTVLGSQPIGFTQTAAPEPSLPAKVPIEKLFTVGPRGDSGPHYRVYATRDPEDPGITIVAAPLSDVEQTLHRLLIVELIVIAAVLGALGLSAFFVVKLGLRPLDRIERDADQIAAGTMSHRVSPATPKTEVGRLGVALNAMLDRLEGAFRARTASEERLRQFLADASHELRTPLASIRGYAELFRMGAASSPADTETAMRRIEEEAKRMGVLVEDLLALARLDEQPDREREPVDLSMLARDAAQDALATAPGRDISVSVPEHAFVSGDTMQLRQVFANLMRNALVHTPAGSPIEVTVKPAAEMIELTVRDHGPGVPLEARERLFERFWRREAGRERGKAGAGLGLAIVHGVVSAHHGTIAVEDAPGGGAAFVVRLPVAAPRKRGSQEAPRMEPDWSEVSGQV